MIGIGTHIRVGRRSGIPPELSDGNWYCQYEAGYAYNDIVTGKVRILKDINGGEQLTEQQFLTPEFDADTNWTKGTGWSIQDGTAIGAADGNNTAISQNATSKPNVWNVDVKINSTSAAGIVLAGFNPSTLGTGAQTYNKTNLVRTSNTIGLSKSSTNGGVVDYIRGYAHVGNHAVQSTTNNQPAIVDDYILFDGVSDSVSTEYKAGLTAVGTAYIVCQRIGTDEAFIVTNTLSAIGKYASSKLDLGYVSSYLNVKIKAVYLRSMNVTDNAATIAKINSYLTYKFGINELDLEYYGGVPDGATDNWELLNALVEGAQDGDKIIIGHDLDDVFVINQPLFIERDNITLEINGVLKMREGNTRALTEDVVFDTNVISVADAEDYFTVGDFVSISDDNMPTGGGGSVARKLGECTQITEVTSTTITLKDNLKNSVYGQAILGITTAANAKVGHTHSSIIIMGCENVSIIGTGAIDNNTDSQYYVHPVVIDPTFANYPYEDIRGGNGVIAWESNDINITVAEIRKANIGCIALGIVNGFSVADINLFNPNYKGIALVEAVNGTLNNIYVKDSYNEDGITFHNECSYITGGNIKIENTTRAGLSIGGGSHNIELDGVELIGNNYSFYSYASPSQLTSHDVLIKNLTITTTYESGYGLALRRLYNFRFENLIINGCQNGGYCIAISEEIDNLEFVGGGAYDTKTWPTGGYGFRVTSEEGYAFNPKNIKFTEFEFKNLKKALHVDSGATVDDVTFTECSFEGNTSNGDTAYENFEFIDCTGL